MKEATEAKARRVRYSVAMSLDGFIADRSGGYDWIIMDPEIDFNAFFEEFDTVLMGRKSYDVARSNPGGLMPGMETIVCSRTLEASDHSDVVIATDAAKTVAALKKKPGKDIWLFGGGSLFRSLLDARLVDTVEVGVIPVLLSDGVPLLTEGSRSPSLKLNESKTLSNGTVMLVYSVEYDGR